MSHPFAYIEKGSAVISASKAISTRVGLSASVKNTGGPVVIKADVMFVSTSQNTVWQFVVADPKLHDRFIAGLSILPNNRLQLITSGTAPTNLSIRRDQWMK